MIQSISRKRTLLTFSSLLFAAMLTSCSSFTSKQPPQPATNQVENPQTNSSAQTVRIGYVRWGLL